MRNLKTLREFNRDTDKIFEELAISKLKKKKLDNYFSDISDMKTNMKKLNLLLYSIKEHVKNDKLNFNLQTNDKEYIEYMCNLNSDIMLEFDIIKNLILVSYEENIEAFIFYMNIVFPEFNANEYSEYDDVENCLNFRYPVVSIERNGLNRVHIPINLSNFLKNTGLGKKLYYYALDKVGYISSINVDRSKEAELVWDSIMDDKNVYSFINDSRVISFKSDLDFKYIENILETKFYNINITNDDFNQCLIDDDFKEKYKEEVENSFLKNLE